MTAMDRPSSITFLLLPIHPFLLLPHINIQRKTYEANSFHPPRTQGAESDRAHPPPAALHLITSSNDLNASSARAELIMTASLPHGKCVLSLPTGAYANAGLYGNSSTGFATDARRARPPGPAGRTGSGDDSPLQSGGRGGAGAAGAVPPPPSTVRLRCLVRRHWA